MSRSVDPLFAALVLDGDRMLIMMFPSQSQHSRVPDVLFVVAQLALLALIALGPRRLGPEWSAPWAGAAVVASVLLAGIGGLLALAAAVQLGRKLTPFPGPRRDAVLVRSGAYRIVRHPIYSGLILMAFGWALYVHGVLTLLLAFVLLCLLDAKTRYEERLLVAQFDDYPDYQREVCRLVPFIY